MCNQAIIHAGPAYEVVADVIDHGATGITLQLFTLYPTARNVEPHKLLEITLPKEDLHYLGLHIAGRTK